MKLNSLEIAEHLKNNGFDSSQFDDDAYFNVIIQKIVDDMEKIDFLEKIKEDLEFLEEDEKNYFSKDY